ncbi:MAG: phosphodiesterase [Rhodospirillaceae bacterium]|jgi:3',5'-cyclic-AMP phosphodiesterase|nr:phosphodiesterase [Rhodospirillaceae bacterium]MBT5195439.1 phosphodiesterase [Rhodospirillaceae bacterium]MBT5897774.1 phosphodiesterase [Rhodospirillaceae bacterium]MBT6430730.1 phosphodiesterase [Rhodospirillaceae bacterium]MBT7756068.1 phosphodiesterase [Rhodospirillaceae bacterium]
MILVQISDTHIDEPDTLVYGHFDTSLALAQAVAAINAMDPAPDLVLHTGDIASHGSVPRYEAFKAIVDELKAPLALMPGNHDDRDALREVFGGTQRLPATGDFLHFVIDDQTVRIICCDSVIAGDTPGEMCAERLAWLDEQLGAATDRPTIVALHHPPFYSGMTGSSAKGLKNGGGELDALLRRHPQVVRVLAGHSHRPMTTAFGGTIAFAGPTTCYPFGLDTGPERVLNVTYEPPAYAVHLWLGDASPAGADLVTHTVPIGDWPAPMALLKAGVKVLDV